MNKMIKRITAILLLMAVIFSVSCVKKEQGSIKIGLLTPLSGENAYIGGEIKKAVELCAEELKLGGGIWGREVEIVVYDDENDPTESVAGYNSLLGEGVLGIIGPADSICALAVMQTAEESGIPVISPTARMREISSFGKNAFRMSAVPDDYGRSAAMFVSEYLKIDRAAVVYDPEEMHELIAAESFSGKCEDAGIDVHCKERSSENWDYEEVLREIMDDGVELVFIPGEKSAKYIASQARTLGFDGEIISLCELAEADSYYVGEYIDTNGQFYRAYEKAYMESPGIAAALAYDSAQMLFSALSNGEKNRNLSNDEKGFRRLTEEILKLEFSGVSGSASFGKNGLMEKTCAVFGKAGEFIGYY